jgi:hypothetical protein
MSRPCSSLVLQAGVVSQSWRSIPSWRTAWSTGSRDGSRTRIRQHSAVRPVLLVTCAPRYGPSWPRVVSRRARSLLDIRSVIPGPHRHTRSGW